MNRASLPLCPCGSGQAFTACCQLLIESSAKPLSAEALMRSRYTAYCLKVVDYIYDTYAKATRLKQSKQDIAAWANSVTFTRLEILSNQCLDENKQFVEFSAEYLQGNTLEKLHEKSRFINELGYWRYLDGEIFPAKSVVLGRNDPCPCLSGKKFKKCHG